MVRGCGCSDWGLPPATDEGRSYSLYMTFLLPVHDVPTPCKERVYIWGASETCYRYFSLCGEKAKTMRLALVSNSN